MGQKSIKKNMVMSIILTSANFVFPLITYSYVSRVLHPVGVGRVTFVGSIITYFQYIAVLGIPAYGVREVAKIRDDKTRMSSLVQELLIINLFSTFISYLLLISAVLLVPKLYSEKALFLIMGVSIFLNTIGLEWVYQALEEYSYITIRSLILKFISVVMTFFLIKTERDVLYYGFLHIFTSSASYVLNFIHVRNYINFAFNNGCDFKRHLQPIFTLFAASIIITIYANFDVTMIGFISTEHEVGLYNTALKIKQIVLSLSTAITTVLIPRMAYYLKDRNDERVGDLIEKSLRVSLDLAIPMAVYIFIFANQCILFLCGAEYLPATNTLRVLISCVIPLVLTNLFGNQILIPSGKEKRYSQSVFVGLWINLILNTIMIPVYGAFGAALATLTTECWNVFWMSGGAKQYRKLLVSRINIMQYLIPLVIASMGSKFILKLISSSVFVNLVITGIVFFATYYIALIIFQEPIIIKQIRSIYRKWEAH